MLTVVASSPYMTHQMVSMIRRIPTIDDSESKPLPGLSMHSMYYRPDVLIMAMHIVSHPQFQSNLDIGARRFTCVSPTDSCSLESRVCIGAHVVRILTDTSHAAELIEPLLQESSRGRILGCPSRSAEYDIDPST